MVSKFGYMYYVGQLLNAFENLESQIGSKMCKYDSTFKIQLHNAHFKVLCFKVLKVKIEIQDLSYKLQLAKNIELYDIFIKKTTTYHLGQILHRAYYITRSHSE